MRYVALSIVQAYYLPYTSVLDQSVIRRPLAPDFDTSKPSEPLGLESLGRKILVGPLAAVAES
jgi:hypothetical protein